MNFSTFMAQFRPAPLGLLCLLTYLGLKVKGLGKGVSSEHQVKKQTDQF